MGAVSADQRAPIGSLPAGARLGRYEILAKLAAGGMAMVYVARAQGVAGFERLVAIKVLHANLAHEEEFIKMFLDEARLAASIRHPNVVPTIDISDSENTGYFIVMEYIEGDHLGQLLSSANKCSEKLPVSVTLRMISDALGGLGAAHDLCDETGRPQNLVHRDVSPHNIMVGRDGVARLTDFGVAKAEDRLTQTRDGQVKGKLAYMAPEQAASGTTDPRSDLFSMGVILWECLTGQRLMRAESTAATLHKLLHSEIPKPSSVDEKLAPLDPVLVKALSRDPDQRYQTAEEFAQALDEYSGGFGMASLREVGKVVKQYAAIKLKRDKKLIEDALKALRPTEEGVLDELDISEESSSPSSSEISIVANAAPHPNVTSKVSGVFANDTMPGTRRAGRRTLEISLPGQRSLLAPPPPAGPASAAPPPPAAPDARAEAKVRDRSLPLGPIDIVDEPAGLESVGPEQFAANSARRVRMSLALVGMAAVALVIVWGMSSTEEEVRVEQMPVSSAVSVPEKTQALMVGTAPSSTLAPVRTAAANGSPTGSSAGPVGPSAPPAAPARGSREHAEHHEPPAIATVEHADTRTSAHADSARSAASANPGESRESASAAPAAKSGREVRESVPGKPPRVSARRRDGQAVGGTARGSERLGLPADVMPNPYHD
jgi:serine/threonine protein kinase